MMRWVGFWILWVGLMGGPCLQAENPVIMQHVSLADASIIEKTLEGKRRIEVLLGPRKFVSTELIDQTAFAKVEDDFGLYGEEMTMAVGKNSIPLNTLPARLEERSWLVDGAGNGFYLPTQPHFQISHHLDVLRIQEIVVEPGQTRRWQWLECGPSKPEEMSHFYEQMDNPAFAPLQITENDDDELIIYDLASKVTAYVIVNPSERMNSKGYLCGSGQPCLVLIQANGADLTVAIAQKRGSAPVRLKIFGDWQPSPKDSTFVKCLPKAGRTWVEINGGNDGNQLVRLIKLPEKSYFERILEAFTKK